MPFTYGSHRVSYDGCINRAPPEQYVSVVPNLVPAPKDTEDVDEDFLQAVTEVFGSEFSSGSSESGAISFSVAPRRQLRPRHGEEEMIFRTLFWCATDVDSSGYVKEWGKCDVGCKAETLLEVTSRRHQGGEHP